MSNKRLIALCYSEWLRWVATGQLIVADRIRNLSGPNDQDEFDRLLDLAPDTGFSDQGYILAELNNSDLPPPEFPDVPQLRKLPISSVLAFYPVTERGNLLLMDDAIRAGVKLSEPIFGKLWLDWVSRRDACNARTRGYRLAEVFGLSETVANWNEFAGIEDYCKNLRPLPNAPALEKMVASSAFAWNGVFGVAFEGINKEVKDKIDEEFGLKRTIIELNGEDACQSACLAERHFASHTGGEILKKISEATEHSSEKALSVLLVVLHYRHLFISEAKVNPDFLQQDLAELVKIAGQNGATLAAYAIGESMPNEAVTSLWLSSPSIRPVVSALPENDRRIVGVSSVP